MKRKYGNRLVYTAAPNWAERYASRKAVLQDVPSLLLIEMPQGEELLVASKAEVDAISDPESLIGRLLRSHSGLLPLSYLSNN